MKTSLLKDSFLEKINLASKFTSSKVLSSNILQCVCLKTEGGRLHLYSTDLNSYYHSSLKTDISKKIQVAIEPRKISEFLSLVDTPKIDLEITEKDLIIESGKTRGDFPLVDATEFPFPPLIKAEKQKIKTDFFKKNLPILLFSASTDETRPALTGINFVAADDGLKIVSTDGFRLSLLNLKREAVFPAAIVPASFLREAMKIIEEEDVSFSYSPQEKILVFFSRDEELYTRLIEGDFPPFERVIPQDKKTTITLDREELLRNVKLVSIFTRESSNVVVLKTAKDEVVITPKTSPNETNVARQEAKVEGEDQKIAFNYRFLLDFLGSVTSEKITIELLRGDAPAVFKAGNLSGFIHIIMPVRIQE